MGIPKDPPWQRKFSQGNFKVPTSHYLINYNINNSFKLLALNAINVAQCFADFFPTFSNINLPGKRIQSLTQYKYIFDVLKKGLAQ